MKAQLARYRAMIEQALQESIVSFGPPTPLRNAIEYALKNGGKRFRPAIVYLVAEAIGLGNDVTDAALAIEYSHTASLIADDLPCMDDDALRREMPSVHKAFGEATAILATYALIAAGYDRLRLGAQKLKKEEICPLAIENASYNTGILGATGGQYDDLYSTSLTKERILEIIDKKTGSFFEISFVFGWLYGGADPALLNQVKQAARSFGRAFQISDDFLDLEQDKSRSSLNYPALAGSDEALSLLNTELETYYSSLRAIGLETADLLALGHFIEHRLATVC